MTLFDVSDLVDPPPIATPLGPETTGRSPANPGIGTAESGTGAKPEVEVRISARRKKTSEARWVGDRIVVSLPAHLDTESRQSTIDWLVDRLLTRHRLESALSDDDLLARAIALSDRYLLGARPASVRWVTNQTARWGSCSWYSGDIRVSHRLRVVPDWVLDSVLVHELAHLTYPDHSSAFHRMASAYPRHTEAGVFLAGFGLGLSTPAGD
jgi:predicted metal-dependent hydrolase